MMLSHLRFDNFMFLGRPILFSSNPVCFLVTGSPFYSPTWFTTHFSLLAHAINFLLTVGNETRSKEA